MSSVPAQFIARLSYSWRKKNFLFPDKPPEAVFHLPLGTPKHNPAYVMGRDLTADRGKDAGGREVKGGQVCLPLAP